MSKILKTVKVSGFINDTKVFTSNTKMLNYIKMCKRAHQNNISVEVDKLGYKISKRTGVITKKGQLYVKKGDRSRTIHSLGIKVQELSVSIS